MLKKHDSGPDRESTCDDLTIDLLLMMRDMSTSSLMLDLLAKSILSSFEGHVDLSQMRTSNFIENENIQLIIIIITTSVVSQVLTTRPTSDQPYGSP
jgi:hypothetical protein